MLRIEFVFSVADWFPVSATIFSPYNHCYHTPHRTVLALFTHTAPRQHTSHRSRQFIHPTRMSCLCLTLLFFPFSDVKHSSKFCWLSLLCVAISFPHFTRYCARLMFPHNAVVVVMAFPPVALHAFSGTTPSSEDSVLLHCHLTLLPCRATS